ncbi:hydrogenase expression/formation protein HypE [Thiorhodospira sibirica]|uniref:hydrogenase expression/formation protein HypE n=1 Tax=Thiorhodospira sibirica TaxID=154347 RepID=UPI00022C39C9|nr:hydrogenase expression/formation protein HypE [Thiorhodospira sibirica]
MSSLHPTPDYISLAHGNGGRLMQALIASVFMAPLGMDTPEMQSDAAPLVLPEGVVVVTTDGFIVKPLEFPGGSIGSLAVHGTVNDLAVAGADPCYLTLNALIEEGLEYALLKRLIEDLAQAAKACGVQVVAGDTKVLPKGEGSGLYLATTGIGVRPVGLHWNMAQIQPGDVILVSGPVGDHGTAVMLAREQFGLRGEVYSDCASVVPLARALRELPGVRFLRDPTRGGVATVAWEVAKGVGCTVHLQEKAIPLRDPVATVCEILGYDPYYLACEGRVVAVVAPDQAATVLVRWQALAQGAAAAIIGTVEAGRPQVILHTALGGQRILPELEDDPLPRIC